MNQRVRVAGEKLLHALRDGMPAMLGWAAIAGVLGALATQAFHHGIGWLQRLAIGHEGSIAGVLGELPWYWLLLAPAVGGLAAGLLLWMAGRLPAGGAADYMESVAIGNGRLSLRQGLLRVASSLCSVASGGSIGREGAMVHLAALGASVLGRCLRLDTGQLRLLGACGAAAGRSAAYGAPLAGTVFIAEIVLGALSMYSVGPLMVAAASAFLTQQFLGHAHPLYALPGLAMPHGGQWLALAALGLACGLAAPAFLKGLDAARWTFKHLALALPWRLGLGGLMLGLLLVALPDAAGNGDHVIVAMLHQEWAWQAVLLILVGKLLATALTVGSGAVGGVFTPALFVGAALGLLFGHLVGVLWPEAALPSALYAAVGMGSLLGAATGAPVMAILMLFEMTRSYAVVAPLMLAVVAAHLMARTLARVAMYDLVLDRERDAELRARLRHATLDDLIRPSETVVSTQASVSDAMQMFADYPVRYLYVVDEDNVYHGVVAHQDLLRLLINQHDAAAARVGDVLRMDYVKALRPGMTLDEIQDDFVRFRGERLPVLSHDEKPRLLGVVYKSAVLEKYTALRRSLETAESQLRWRRPAG